MLPATGWLSARIGRGNLFFVAVGGFTLFSLACRRRRVAARRGRCASDRAPAARS